MATDVLLITEAPIATVQLLEQMLQHLAKTTDLRTRSRQLDEVRGEDLNPGTFPLFVRTCHPEAVRLARLFRRHGVRYGFYLDDNFWLLDPETEIGQHYAAPTVRFSLEEMVRRASVVVAATPLLQQWLRSRNRRVEQLDSFFDFSLVPELPPPPAASGFVRGGYAASASRGADLLVLLNVIVELLEQHPGFEFELIGIQDGIPEHPRLRTHAYRSSYQDYVAFQRSRQWNFALAPLGGAASNLYKTDNKFREYAAQGIPGIYQDAPPYASVRDGETGLLAGGDRSWREAIELYLGNADLRAQVRRAAHQDARERISLEAVAPSWARFFENAPGMGSERIDVLREIVDHLPGRFQRARHRAWLLWAYGLAQVERDGWPRTIGRTLRFVARKAVGRP